MGSEVRGVPGAAALGEPPRSEPQPTGAAGATGAGGEPADASIGAYLRAQRELRGIGLAELEAVTRIPRRSLERLEAGEFDARPDGFARGFVRAVALALGLDPDETVSRMLPEPAPAAPASLPGLDPGRLLAVGLVLLALAGGAVWWVVRDAGPGTATGAADAEVVWRRDPVRALAARVEEADGPAPPPAVAGPLGPPPPPAAGTPVPPPGVEAPAPAPSGGRPPGEATP